MNVVERAREIRKELKKEFPNTKFSVRSSKYSGGSSINISWTDFPTVKSVEEVTNKYKSVRYDEYTGEVLCGGNTFIFANNSWSEDMEESIKENLISKYGVEFYNEHIVDAWGGRQYQVEAFERLYNASLEVEEVKEVSSDKKELYSNEEVQILEVGKTTRVYFDGKPSEETRNNLKALGFRFYKNDGFYWGIYTNKTTLEAIKEAIKEAINIQEVKEIKPIEVVEVENTVYLNDVKVGRKENNILDVEEYGSPENILIEKYIILKNDDFDYMCNNLLDDFTFLSNYGGSRAIPKEGTELPEEYDFNYIYNNRDKFDFYEINILITNESNDKFIVVNPHGYNYCRYTGVLTVSEGKRVLKKLKGEVKINKLQVIENDVNTSENMTNVEKCNSIYLEVEALENRLKLVNSQKLKNKIRVQIDNKMKEIVRIILSDELLYLQFIQESKKY